MGRFFRNYGVELALVGALALAVVFFGYLALGLLPSDPVDETFAGSRALDDVGRQMAFGTRSTGTQGSADMSRWLVQQLTGLGWDVVIQEYSIGGALTGRNLIAVRSPEGGSTSAAPVGLLVTHYDTRMAADGEADPANQQRPAPGANNGASGTAVLLELARTLNMGATGHTVCLAFFDGDANEGLPGWEGRLGSAHLARTLAQDTPRCNEPRFVVALDMVGSESATYRIDPASDAMLSDVLWRRAAETGYGDSFLPEAGPDTLNAHTPFAAQGIPTALIADLEYPAARTLADTVSRLNEGALQRVGRTLELWLESGAPF
jgi:glutaminyl-peptide cyclotransferase